MQDTDASDLNLMYKALTVMDITTIGSICPDAAPRFAWFRRRS
jgi:hypothetical protein